MAKKKSVHPLEAKVDRLFAESASSASTAVTTIELPSVDAPPLSALRVQLTRPPAVTADEVGARFHRLLRERAQKKDRPSGTPVELGDEVQVDIVGYADKVLIPGSVRVGAWMDLEPMPHLPGFAETVAGTRVGDACALDMELPEDYPVPTLAGKQARFLVEVRAAREVLAPDPEDAAALKALGLGDSLQAAMDKVTELVDEERAALESLRFQDAVLDTLSEHTQVELPPALVDEEIRLRWAAHEQPLLKEKGFHPDEQQEALQAWQHSAQVRADAERRLRVSLALEAVGRREGWELSPEELHESLRELAAELGLDVREAAQVVEKDPALAERLTRTARHLMLVSRLVAAAS